MGKYLPTGNEYLSLDKINQETAALETVSVLHMGYRGMLENEGNHEKELLKPYITCNGIKKTIDKPTWKRIDEWIPSFSWSDSTIGVNGTILAPTDERGFIYALKVINLTQGELKLELGVEGCISSLNHIMNETRKMLVENEIKKSNWNHSILFCFVKETDVISYAPIFDRENEGDVCVKSRKTDENDIEYCFTKERTLQPGESAEFISIWGVGYEEVSAATAAKEILRYGYERELQKTKNKLQRMSAARQKACRTEIPAEIKKISDLNSFFCYYYATGRTIDTQEAVMVTSRSTRYYVSAAFWDRDALLWAFPCILQMDEGYARELLLYAYTRQKFNMGIHSRYIDGMLLEPGFELDELCAPLYALTKYIEASNDYTILEEGEIRNGINFALKRLSEHKNDKAELYETFLLPSDDETEYEYITYDNALLSVTLRRLGMLFENGPDDKSGKELIAQSERIRRAIMDNCIVEHEGKKIYAWAVDLRGKYQIYDEPPGSLQLLLYYGFTDVQDEAYQNTMNIIRGKDYQYSFYNHRIDEIGCAHANHPWVLSLSNSLLCGNRSHAMELLTRMNMDYGIACESVHEDTGECTTGEAFATCAGFLAYAINQ